MHLLYSDIMLYIIKCILKIMEHCGVYYGSLSELYITNHYHVISCICKFTQRSMRFKKQCYPSWITVTQRSTRKHGWITGEVLTVKTFLEPSHISHRFPAAAYTLYTSPVDLKDCCVDIRRPGLRLGVASGVGPLLTLAALLPALASPSGGADFLTQRHCPG